MKRIVKYGGGIFVLLLLASQLVRPERTNPPADPAVSWEARARPPAAVAEVIGRACRDCHSNRTVWPWYSKIAPVSWLVASDVSEGRGKLNFSRWDIYSPEVTHAKSGQVCSEVRTGEMPPEIYVMMHPDAKLSAADIAALCASGL
jgi:hypothetical protein